MKRERADALVVERGLAPDLKTARAYIMAGEIIIGEHRVDSAGKRLPADAPVRRRARRKHRYVSRGGLKLEGGLEQFGIDPTGWTCLDLGASTGGFTDCLLQHGARTVYAVDVGYGLLDWQLQRDPRVVNLERTHAAALDHERVPEPIDLLVADISFNSLSRVLPPAVALLAPTARIILLIKPQFEVDASEVGEGGIVRDPAARARARDRVTAEVEALGFSIDGVEASPITGTKGNVEYVLAGQRSIG